MAQKLAGVKDTSELVRNASFIIDATRGGVREAAVVARDRRLG